MKKSLKLLAVLILHLALLWGWIAVLDGKRGPLPPLGRFLSPFEGFWRNAEPVMSAREEASTRSEEVILENLTATVVAEYDHRAVPHLFAPDLHTLFFAQGYVTARDRLWQMDIQSRAGMGRLSEIMGPSLLRFDQERRRLGMPASARASLEVMRRDSLTRVALEGYAEGVNAFISSLTKATYPLEFKLLGYEPEPWSPLKSVILLKNMQWVLTRDREDVGLARVADSLGAGFFSRYYPVRHPGAEPVFPREVLPVPPRDGADTVSRVSMGRGPEDGPANGKNVNRNGNPGAREGGGGRGGLRGVGAVATATGREGREDARAIPAYPGFLASHPDPSSGSNNFVIAGSRTRAGTSLLANDPHLDLTLPSLWYEIQLKSGDINAYGASLPGLPGIAIGFTRTTAWGFTNGMNDVFDWHELRFRNDSLNHYLWRGRWRETRRVIDTILVRGRAPVIDTQLWTHAGPIPVYTAHGATRPEAVESPFGDAVPPLHALQWTALHPSNDLGAFLRLLTASNVASFRRALRPLETPALNVAFATRGDIALMHQGRMPVKRPGRGRMPARGNVSATEWRFYLPASELPASVNPARGWLASANQELTDADDPRFFGAGFYPPERSQRLHRLLVNEREATLSSAWEVMRDDYSRLAARAVPRLLQFLPEARDTGDVTVAHAAAGDSGEAVRESAAMASGPAPPAVPPSPRGFDAARARRAIDLLRAWDYRHAPSATAPPLFVEWWKRFHYLTWRDELRGDTATYMMPSRSVTLSLLLTDSLAAPFDDVTTPQRETAGDIARAAFADMLDTLAARKGKDGVEWITWGRHRPVSIPHLLRLGPLGVSGLETGGCAECVNAQKESHGPSWRMVVQTGNRPEAWGIYPGGQSGNPGSPRYDAFVRDWAEGRAYRLLFLKWPLEMPDSTAYILALKGKR